MKLFKFFILFIAIISESTLVSLPLTLSLILIYSFIEIPSMDIWAFAGGLILDLFIPRTPGIDSLIFLVIIIISRRYQKKWHSGQLIFFIIFLIVSLSAYTYVFYRNVYTYHFVVLCMINIFIYFLIRKYLPGTGRKNRLAL